MTIYYILIGLLLASLLTKEKKKLRKYLFFADAVVFLRVLATRDATVGNDTEGYVEMGLGNIMLSEAKSGIEILWGGFVDLFQKTRFDSQVFIFLTAILEFVTLFIFIAKESENKIFSLLLYVILVTGLCAYMTAIRQAIALGFVLFAFYFLKQHKPLLCALFILLGMGFHTTSIIAVVFIPFVFLNYNRTLSISLVVISALLGFILRQDVFSAYSSISQYFTFLQIYSGYGYETVQAPNLIGLTAIILPSTIIAVCSILLYKDHPYTKIFVVGVILVNMFASTPFIERYFMYATMLQLVLTPKIYKHGNDSMKLLIVGSVLMLILYFFKSVPYSTGADNYISILF